MNRKMMNRIMRILKYLCPVLCLTNFFLFVWLVMSALWGDDGEFAVDLMLALFNVVCGVLMAFISVELNRGL